MISTEIQAIQTALLPLQTKIVAHPLIQKLGELDTLRYFMSQHVFIVWDFVNLIKALHSRLTRTQLPWWPAQDADAIRLLYEILIEEETDQHPDDNNTHTSHLDLYLQAMQSCQADSTPFKDCIQQLQKGNSLINALQSTAILASTRTFVQQTFAVCAGDNLPALAAYFVFGREAMVPQLFQPWLTQLQRHKRPDTQALEYYLSRHIELDSQSHFPKAAKLLSSLCGKDPDKWQVAENTAKQALEARLHFLEGISSSIRQTN